MATSTPNWTDNVSVIAAATRTSASPDASINTAVAAVWNALAGAV